MSQRPAARKHSSLWRHADFLKLWSAQTSAQFGTQVTLLAIPIAAAVTLEVSPRQMGFLTAAGTLPFLLIGLFAGVVVDRMRRRPILIAADLGRALVLAVIPITALFDLLTLEVLFVVTFVVGIQTVFFEVSYQSYLPALIERKHLVDGNSKLETSRAGAQILGPGIAGGLIQVLTAPFAIVLNSVTFVVSGLLLAWIRRTEPEPEPRLEGQSVRQDIAEGVRFIARHPFLRPLAGCTGTSNFFSAMFTAIFILYATRNLGLSAGLIGVIFGAGSAGFLLGALAASKLSERFGPGPTIVAGIGLTPIGMLIVPLASGPSVSVTAILILAIFIMSCGGAIYNVNQVSLRQSVTPDRLLGRMNATMRFIVWGTLPIGGVAGGFLADVIGLRATLLVAGLGSLLPMLWVLFSDVRSLREQPQAYDPDVPATAA